MIFETLFLIGLVGFFAMAAMGGLHGHGHHHDSAHAGPHGHDHGPIGHHTPHAHHGDNPATAGHGHHAHDAGAKLLRGLPALISPMNLFAWCLASGASGILLRQRFPDVTTLWAIAATIGIVFTFALVRPLMSFILNFASKPSEGLEGQVSKEAEALCNFDEQGRGLIKLVLDGEVKQLLATLDPIEKRNGLEITKGERVYISSIDAEKGTCIVIGELT